MIKLINFGDEKKGDALYKNKKERMNEWICVLCKRAVCIYSTKKESKKFGGSFIETT
jgi:hypothetical protein